METKTVVQELIELCGLDIDASHCYQAAVKNIEIYEIREIAGTFLSDHNRHISYLSELIAGLGGLAPVNQPSERGVWLSGKLRPVDAGARTRQTLEEMLENEQRINEAYGAAAGQDMGTAHALILRNLADERKHLQYIREWVRSEVWDRLPDLK